MVLMLAHFPLSQEKAPHSQEVHEEDPNGPTLDPFHLFTPGTSCEAMLTAPWAGGWSLQRAGAANRECVLLQW